MDIMSTVTHQTACAETCESQTDQEEEISREIFPAVAGEDRPASETEDSADQGPLATVPARRSVDWSDSVDSQQSEEDIMQISGKGHWFLEGWIGDHAVDFLVDSGSAVTAVSRSFFDRLTGAGAPVGPLRPTERRLRGANGSQIEISGCSYCVVSFLGLRAEFHILVCDLSTDAIIGTDTLGSVLPHTLDIKKGLLFTEGGGGCHFNCIGGMLRCPVVSSQWDIALSHRIQRQFFTVLPGRWGAGHSRPADSWRD